MTRGTARFIAGLAAGIAFAAGLGLGLLTGWRMRGASYRLAAEEVRRRTAAPPVTPVSDVALGAVPAVRRVQFTLVAPAATRVALVGEFNDWDPRATPMVRVGGGAWHVALPLADGRHVYAFVVDGSSWVSDPQAPLAPERWYGASNSVLLVRGVQKQ
jgi:1,4-alpha-glucan branching enzyme